MLSSALNLPSQFEFNFPVMWTKSPKCCVCSQEFILSAKTNIRRPLLLKCSHSVCDRCCINNRPTSITCSTCSQITNIDRRLGVREALETNYHVTGLLNYKQFHLNYDLDFAKLHKPAEKETAALQECGECNDALTNTFCIQCSVPYCKNCFEQVHKHGKILQKHCLSKFDRRGSITMKNEDKKCRKHNAFIVKYCGDCKISLCAFCANENHSKHSISSILDENHRSLGKIQSLIETVKSAKESNKQAHKDAKFIEKRYEQFASTTVDDISNYFIYLHGVLQNVERKALFEVKNNMQTLLTRMHQSQTTLKNGLDSLEELLVLLQSTASNPPANFAITNLIEKSNSILESVPCNIEFDDANENPFEFTELKKRPVDFPNLFELKIDIDNYRSKIYTFFGDLSNGEASVVKENKSSSAKQKKNKNKKTNSKPSDLKSGETTNMASASHLNLSNTSLGSISSKLTTSQKVHVSHIKNPQRFFVQTQKFLAKENDFQQFIATEADYATSPEYIDYNVVYLVLNSNKTWYRGQVVGSPSHDTYKMFLLDYGNCIEVPKQNIRVISDSLKAKPVGAIECCLYGIKPKQSEWTDKANQLMSEIIVNELMNMILIKEDEICQVDLIASHLNYPVSVREALLFADLALVEKDQPADIQGREKSLNGIKKNLLTGPSDRFYKNVFKEGESFRGIILSINDPHHFFAIKYDHKLLIDKLYEELNRDYQESQPKMYTPQVHSPCAVYIDGNWYRARITEVFPKIKCTIWLVDKATFETVPVSQLRVLLPKYISLNECTFQCSLIDIEPLQKNNYSWTKDSIADFKRITRNPNLQVFIHRSKDFRYKIGLYIIKKEMDISVNAMLVKYKHANSTGPESLCVEYPKSKEYLQDTDDDLLSEISAMEIAIKDKPKSKANIRSRLKVCYIISPGEFYVYKNEHQIGINKLHDEIQTACDLNGMESVKLHVSSNEMKWKVGENCLVRLKFNEEGILQWYRATITEISCSDNDDTEENKYTVFLRDHGQTFANILSKSILPISNLYDRVCNGAIKCHLACIQPTGGLKVWSGASIDEFKVGVNKYEELAGSIQGERVKDSIAIVLWGLMRECSDALAPTIFKWINLNKTLVNCGLGHLVEKFTALTDDNAMQNDTVEGQESFNEWLENINQVVDKTIKNDHIEILRRVPSLETVEELEIDHADSNENITAWLPAKSIIKTTFMGIPTCVDNDFVIYLYKESQKRLLENMRTIINQKAATLRKGIMDSFWYTGQPCLAKYHLDQKLYRATVLETKPDRTVSVQFVDYGNIEDCSTIDLHKELALTDIPIQATKFKLDRIVPPDNCAKFSVDALDYVHSLIVGKICWVRVLPDQNDADIKLCSMKLNSDDIADLMIQEGFGRAPGRHLLSPSISLNYSPSKLVPTSPRKPVETPLMETPNDSDEEEIDKEEVDDEKPDSEDEKKQEEAFLDTEEYCELFDKIDYVNLYDSINISSGDDTDADIVEQENTYKPACCSDNPRQIFPKTESSDETTLLIEPAVDDISPLSFDPNPNDASTTKSDTEIEQYRPMKLGKDVTSFKCEITYIKNATNLVVYPLIREHKKRFFEMSKYIQKVATTAASLKSYAPKTPCLAVFSEDSLWYRAIIRSHNEGDKRADVLFVDFWNTEMVQCKRIRCCPSNVVRVPLRNIPIELSGVKPNPRWREADIHRKLADIVEDGVFYAKIVKSNDVLPQVELYESSNANRLIYDSLIAERFFLLSNN